MLKLNKQAIFSDETRNFVSNPFAKKGETITIALRVGKDDIKDVLLMINGIGIPMQKSCSKGLFDYYKIQIMLQNNIEYYFIISADNRQYFYNKAGVTDVINTEFNFRVIPDFDVPLWAQNTVMYQIFIDRFYNGDPTNDVTDGEYTYLGYPARKMDWDEPVQPVDICNFYGGDLSGIAKKMDYLADLGIEAIYLNPIFTSPSSHKYDISDYDNVDLHFGDNALLADLIALAHSKGIKVILDGVFNHCGHMHRWLDEKPEYFIWNGDKYEAWWGHENHPKLNFEGSPELYEEILRVAADWVSPPYNADGWRLDVAADLGQAPEFNLKFWQDFRNRVKAANPQAFILAEHYGNPSYWLQGDAWDSVMNYDGFMEPISWFFTGMQKHSEKFLPDLLNNAAAFEGAMRHYATKLPHAALSSAMNQLSNHDHSRFLTRTNMRIGRLHTHGNHTANDGTVAAIMLSATTALFTLPGCPTIYYGDEAGLAGWTDPDNRRTFPWGNEDETMLDFHKEIIRIHKENTALRGGSLDYLHGEYGVIAYARWDDKQSIIIAINNSYEHKSLALPAWRAEIAPNSTLTRILLTTENHFIADKKTFLLDEGTLFITLPPLSSTILTTK
ncbi:MAG: glycoside hydrolase family 13 protein [Defluviitaleaceae bacterium]|nr:glycoside hydrolase family 13 protein [Defluviitaleaceae bacterium]